MANLTVGDLDVEYEIHSSGPPVVLISGTGGDLRRDPNRHRHPLTKRCTVLMYDQRGLGRTSKPDGPYSMAGYADDAAALMDALGWDDADIVGISFGGMVAQELVLRHPGRVRQLVLACTSSGGRGGSSFDLLSNDGLAPEQRARTMLPIMDTRNDPDTDPPTYAPLYETLGPAMTLPPLNADDPRATLGARLQLEARAGHDTWDRLPTVDNETFVIGGRYDGQAPPANVERLAARIPNAELRFFDGGHLFFLQDRSAWPAVGDFLSRPR